MKPIAKKLKRALENDYVPNVKPLVCALKKKPTCQLCHSWGVIPHLEDGLAKAKICDCILNCEQCFGKCIEVTPEGARKCSTHNPHRSVNLYNQANIPGRYYNANYTAIDKTNGNGDKVYSAVDKWLNDFDLNKSKGILISGPVGVGKTYLLVAMMRQLIRKGISVRYVDFMDIIDRLKASYSSGKHEFVEVEYLNIDVLVIDEIGKGRVTDFEQGVLDQMINARYNRCKINLMATNYNVLKKLEFKACKPEEFDATRAPRLPSLRDIAMLDRVGERIFSRILEVSQLIYFYGDDRRKKGIVETDDDSLNSLNIPHDDNPRETFFSQEIKKHHANPT